MQIREVVEGCCKRWFIDVRVDISQLSANLYGLLIFSFGVRQQIDIRKNGTETILDIPDSRLKTIRLCFGKFLIEGKRFAITVQGKIEPLEIIKQPSIVIKNVSKLGLLPDYFSSYADGIFISKTGLVKPV